ncbi:glycosyltransferase 2 family protein [Candidatus Magnetomoraceae bacterium gMMP-13]
MLKRKNIIILLKFLISLSLLGWFIMQTDFSKVLKVLGSIPFYIIFLAVIINIFAFYINAVKWHKLLNNFKLMKLFSLNLIALYYMLILPGQIAGELVKTYKLAKGRREAEQIAASVIIDRITGIIGLMLVAMAGLILSKTSIAKNLTLWFSISIIVFSLLLYLFYFKSVENIIKRFALLFKKSFTGTIIEPCLLVIAAWRQYLKNPFMLLQSICYGIAYQLICVYVNIIIARALNIDITFVDWCWIFGVISIALFLPITISGIGVREGGFIFLLGNMGVEPERALAMSLSLLGLHVVCAFIGGILDFQMDFKYYKRS